MSQDTQSLDYRAPSIVTALRPYLDLPRFQYSSDFAKFLDDESDEHEKYKEGLIAIGGMIGIIFFLWGGILLILRCNGKTAGCGAGFPFKSKEPDQQHFEQHSGATEQTTGDSSSRRKFDSRGSYDLESVRSSTQSYDAADEMELYGQSVSEFSPVSKREQRTQFFFWIFSAITIICAPMIILLVILPLTSTAEQVSPEVSYAREIIREMTISIGTINSSFDLSRSIAQRFPSNFTSLCPRENFENVSDILLGETIPEIYQASLESANDNLWKMHKLMKDNTQKIHAALRNQLAGIDNFYTKFDSTFEYAESAGEDSMAYLWFVAILLIITVAATGILMVGAYMSRVRQATEGLQQALSYGVLPVLLITTAVAWTIAVGAAVATVIGDDVCNNGSNEGSPHETFMAILETFQITKADPLYGIVSAYTGECEKDADPVAGLQSLEEDIQEATDAMWQILSDIGKVGTSKLNGACGAEAENLETFLVDSADLARTLTIIQRSVGSLTGTMKCDRVYPLYIQTVEETACKGVAGPVAWAIIVFFMLGVSTMGMITLRSAWRHEIEGDEIYDEDEEIENMFVDEHEEYLAYISKYKHEWEDCEGCDANVRPKNRSTPVRPIYPVYPSAKTRRALSRTHSSDSGSEKESHLVGEEFFEDEHFAMSSDVLKPGYANEGPFEISESVTYSPTTVASGDFSFISSTGDGETPTNPENHHHTKGGSLLGRSPDNHDDVIEIMESEIKGQRARDMELIQRLSRGVKRQNSRELKLIEKLSARSVIQNGVVVSQAPGATSGSTRADQHPDQDCEDEDNILQATSTVSLQVSTESEDDTCTGSQTGAFPIRPDHSAGLSTSDDDEVASAQPTELSPVPTSRGRTPLPPPIDTGLSPEALPLSLDSFDDEKQPPPINSFDNDEGTPSTPPLERGQIPPSSPPQFRMFDTRSIASPPGISPRRSPSPSSST